MFDGASLRSTDGGNELFNLNTRFQIAAILMLLVLIFDYMRNKHLKLFSTKCFRCMLVATGFNLIFDIITVYTISHMDTVPQSVNRVFHQLFIMSVIVNVFIAFFYIFVLANDQKRLGSRKMMLALIPMIIAIVMVIFGKLNYHVGATTVYSYGPMAYTVYACGFIYFILALAETFNIHNSLRRNQRIASRTGLIIWASVLVYQMMNPGILLSGLGLVLMVLATYFSFENPMENTDGEIEIFNNAAFHKMLSEYFEGNNKAYVINVVCDNYDRINTLLGHSKGIEALVYTRTIIERYFNNYVFRSGDNSLCFFIENEEITETSSIYRNILRMEYSLMHNEFRNVKIEYHIDIVDIKKYASDRDDVCELISYMAKTPVKKENTIIKVLDKAILDKKLRQDKIYQLLVKALKEDGFEMYYQPIFWPETGMISSAEALIRMKEDTELGYISPEEFIPLAEEKGLIMDIGDKVLKMVSRFINENELIDTDIRYIEVNLSGIQIVAPDIEMRVKDIASRYKIPPSMINLEITETAAVDAGYSLSNNINALKNDGFSFSMDDYGTGYSNLAQMNSVSYDLVKIDKSLIWPAFGFKCDDEESIQKAKVLLNSVIHMLKKLGVGIVAEGVETKEMVDFLSKEGVHHLQGYYYSKPVCGEQFADKYIVHKGDAI